MKNLDVIKEIAKGNKAVVIGAVVAVGIVGGYLVSKKLKAKEVTDVASAAVELLSAEGLINGVETVVEAAEIVI